MPAQTCTNRRGLSPTSFHADFEPHRTPRLKMQSRATSRQFTMPRNVPNSPSITESSTGGFYYIADPAITTPLIYDHLQLKEKYAIQGQDVCPSSLMRSA